MTAERERIMEIARSSNAILAGPPDPLIAGLALKVTSALKRVDNAAILVLRLMMAPGAPWSSQQRWAAIVIANRMKETRPGSRRFVTWAGRRVLSRDINCHPDTVGRLMKPLCEGPMAIFCRVPRSTAGGRTTDFIFLDVRWLTQTGETSGRQPDVSSTPSRQLVEGVPEDSSGRRRTASGEPLQITTTTAAATFVAAGSFSRMEASGDYLERYPGAVVPEKTFPPLKALAAKNTWKVVRPLWREYLKTVESRFQSAQDFAGKWFSEHVGKPQGGLIPIPPDDEFAARRKAAAREMRAAEKLAEEERMKQGAVLQFPLDIAKLTQSMDEVIGVAK